MTCLDCGAATKTHRNETVAYDFGGLPDVSLHGIEVRVCANGHREYVIPRIEELHRVIAVALAGKAYGLTTDEMRFMRKYVGWSQVDLAKEMGVTPETVNRWESGAMKMKPTAERLLRLLVLHRQPVRDYRVQDLFSNVTNAAKAVRMRIASTAKAWKVAA